MLISVLRLAAIVVAATAPEPPPGPLGLHVVPAAAVFEALLALLLAAVFPAHL